MSKKKPDPSIGELIRERRAALGKTLTEVAADVGSTASHLSAIELGKTNPTEKTLKRLAGVLGEISIKPAERRSKT